MIPQLAITITLILSAGEFSCGSTPVAAGCYDKKNNSITINTELNGEDFKRVLLHEFAHAKFDNHPDIERFAQMPAREGLSKDNAQEKMASWFSFIWGNLPMLNINSWLYQFFLE